MRLGPDIARIAALLADPARANIMTALCGGQALTAGELAREAGITPQTASSHLAKLVDGRLLETRRQGRHAYYALSGPDTAALLEGLMGLATASGHLRARPGPREPALRKARVCYDHLAGELAVAMLEGLTARAMISDRDGALCLTGRGAAYMQLYGIEVETLARGRRPLCRACLDWSERRNHLAGVLGAAILTRTCELGWAARREGTRVLEFSPSGLAAFERFATGTGSGDV
jgi:DNA-binding transcriptional ArsR family regulator